MIVRYYLHERTRPRNRQDAGRAGWPAYRHDGVGERRGEAAVIT